jgi:shikimate kinase
MTDVFLQVKRMYVQVTCSPLSGWMPLATTSSSPSARTGATVTPSYDGRYAYLFGGLTAAGASNDLYKLATAEGFDDALPAEQVNLALSRLAYHSSTNIAYNGTASLAVSGTINTAFRVSNVQYCTSTNVENNPWYVF